MKTKIFLAFIIVILTALVSDFIFESLIIKDFDDYVAGVRDDQFHWVLIAVQDSYHNGQWDREALHEAVHWAMMLGLDTKVLDPDGKEIISSHDVMKSLSEGMKSSMENLFHVGGTGEAGFKEYPLLSNGRKIGMILTLPFEKKELFKKEASFEKRARTFLYASFIIAGAGSLLIGLLLTIFLTKPVIRLTEAAEKIAGGEFKVRINTASRDEVGKLSAAFNKMASSLQKEEELRKRLMSNIAHELRTPLTIMKTQVEGMSDGIIKDRSKGLQYVGNEIERLISLVRGIEDITAAEASFFEKVNSTEVNIKDFIQGLVDEFLPLFQGKHLDIKISKNDDLIAYTDVDKLDKIVRNILSNALKFTEQGGVVVDYGDNKDIFFIEISDTGKGLSETEIPLIFNRFYRGEKPYAPGLGLGLAIVKELIEVIGGRIDVKSSAGQGTTFRVSFPLKIEQ
jgi:two-component system sensor histidine kinase BaeS